MFLIYLLVFILAALGALFRWKVGEWLNLASFPWGTLLVNILGCLCMGGVTSQMTQSSYWVIALTVGFLGAFTTFSAYMMESIHLISEGYWLKAISYILASNGLGLLAYWCGWSFCGAIK